MMNVFEFLTKNWAQITVMLGAIGYVLKVFFDFRIKKLEIKFGLLFSQKTTEFQKFIELYDKYVAQLIKESFGFVYGTSLPDEYDKIVKTHHEQISLSISHLRIYLSKRDKEVLFSILNSMSLMDVSIKKVKNSDIEQSTKSELLSTLLLDFQKKNEEILNKIFQAYKS